MEARQTTPLAPPDLAPDEVVWAERFAVLGSAEPPAGLFQAVFGALDGARPGRVAARGVLALSLAASLLLATGLLGFARAAARAQGAAEGPTWRVAVVDEPGDSGASLYLTGLDPLAGAGLGPGLDEALADAGH